MKRLGEHETGILMSAMSDASAASLLGRSVAWVRRHRAVAARGEDAVEVMPVVLRSVSHLEQTRPSVVGYVRRFHQAGWTLAVIAWLFDLSPEDVAEVVFADPLARPVISGDVISGAVV